MNEQLQLNVYQRYEMIKLLYYLIRLGLIDYSEKDSYIDYYYERD